MNPDLSAPLTREEFFSLRDCAKGLMHRTIPAEHKDRLIQLGYIQELSGGPADAEAITRREAGMKKLINAVENVVSESLAGFCAAHSGIVRIGDQSPFVQRRHLTR